MGLSCAIVVNRLAAGKDWVDEAGQEYSTSNVHCYHVFVALQDLSDYAFFLCCSMGLVRGLSVRFGRVCSTSVYLTAIMLHVLTSYLVLWIANCQGVM